MRLRLPLHDAQREVLFSGTRFKSLVCGRRFGKSTLAIWSVLLKTLEFPRRPSLVSPEVTLVTMPTMTQAIGVLWRPLVALAESEDFARYGAKVDRVRYTISFPGKPVIQVAGANDRQGDRLRGKRLWYLLADEYQDFLPGIWETVLRPALSDTPGSSALFTGTPKGKLNHFYALATTDHPDFGYFQYPTAANPCIPWSELANAKATLPPRLYRQEYLATWEDYPGQIYYELSEDNVCQGYPEPEYTVAGYDFGDVNPAITVLGVNRGHWYFLEGWQPTEGVPVPQVQQDTQLLRLLDRWNPRAVLCDPSRPSTILGLRRLRVPLVPAVAGYNRIEEGITQVHSLIYQRRLMFPEGSGSRAQGRVDGAHAYQLFRSYHRRTMGELVYPEVAPGQDDHCLTADSMVITDQGEVPICEVVAGSLVWTRQGWKKVLWSGQTGVRSVATYRFSDGRTLTATPDHLVAVGDQWTPIDTLCYDGYVVSKVDAGFQPVFNLHVQGCHEFYANGVLVHNCLDSTRYSYASPGG